MTGEAGFRVPFDEEVRLPDDLPAIDVLEQVELLPFVEEVPGRDGPRLKGHLQLTALYAAEGGDGAVRTFTRQIPVDISLPARSASQGGKVRLDIGQFDVEPASGRSLNISGVLTLTGLSPIREGTETAESGADETGDGEIVAVHRAAKKKKSPSDEVQVVAGDVPAEEFSFPATAKPEDGPEDEAGKTEPAGAALHPDAGHTAAGGADWPNEQHEPHGQQASKPHHEHDDPDWDDWQDAGDDVPADRADRTDGTATTGEMAAGRPGEAETSAPEPKVAFKPLEETPADDSPAAVASSKAGKANNELEWRRLFLSESGEEPLRKLRLCIVQRDETIDTIAERYRLHPREIALYNRLSDQGLTEGQVLYIPLS